LLMANKLPEHTPSNANAIEPVHALP